MWHVGVVLIAITRKGDFYCEVLWCLYLWVWHVGVVLIAITGKGDFYCEVLWFAEGVFILVGVACGCGFDSHNQKRGLLL